MVTVFIVVPFAAGSTFATDEMVVPDAIVVYWEVPALSEIHRLPTFFASAADSPMIDVSPLELPLM